jgi:hypothetical protein
MCEGYVFGVQRGVGEREEVRLRILRHPFGHLEKSVLALPPKIVGAIVCMSHFCPLESQSEKHNS